MTDGKTSGGTWTLTGLPQLTRSPTGIVVSLKLEDRNTGVRIPAGPLMECYPTKCYPVIASPTSMHIGPLDKDRGWLFPLRAFIRIKHTCCEGDKFFGANDCNAGAVVVARYDMPKNMWVEFICT